MTTTYHTTFLFRRDYESAIPTLQIGEPFFSLDTHKFFLGSGSGNIQISGSGVGSGTVTSFAFTNANGITGTVSTATTTPTLSLVLGAITPTSIVASGSVSGSNLSGTNTGDQTITLSGDVSGSGTGAITTAIGAGKVTNTMLAGSIDLTAKVTGTLPVLNGGTGVTTSTGSGNNVLSGTPTLVTPILGVASATSINKITITTPATGATLTLIDGKTFTVNNTLTLSGTDGSTLNMGTGGTLGTAAYTAASAYEVPLTFSTGLTRSTNTVTVNTSQNIATLSNLTSNGFVKTSGGAGTLGVSTTVSLSADVSGTLPFGNGGTGQTAYTDGQLLIGNTSTGGISKAVLTAGSNITITNGNGSITIAASASSGMTNPMTTLGDIIYGGAAGAPTRLAGNTTTTPQFYTSTGSAGAATAVTLTGSTGSGSVVLATSPALTTPNIGVATATSVNKLTITAPTTSAVLTILDGKTATFNNSITFAGTDTTTMTFPSTSATIARTDAANTFTGVQTMTSASLITPNIGVATATSVNKVAITAPATSATLTIANGKTATVNNTLTLAGTDSTTMTFPTTSATIARTDAANTFTGHQTIEGITSSGATGTGKFVFDTSPTLSSPAIGTIVNTGTLTLPTSTDTLIGRATTDTLTNKRITPRVNTEASSATSTPTGDSSDAWTITALAAADTVAAPTGTPTDMQKLIVRIKDNATARALTWNAIYRASSDLALPSTTIISKTMYLGFIYNSADSKWDFLAYLNNF